MSGGEASGTNQIAELRALFEAIVAHPGPDPLLIESDSQYAIKCASDWLPSWKRKGWKTSSGGDVKNLDLVRSIDRAISDRRGPVRFRWVRGHVGNHYNEVADTLAGEAARAIVSGDIASVPLAPFDTAPVAAPAEVKRDTPAVNPAYESKSVAAEEPADLFTLF